MLHSKFVQDLLPQKSKNAYLKTWDSMLSWNTVNEENLSEEHFLGYLNYLREEKHLQGSSLWCTFSKLNAANQAKFGQKHQQKFPRLVLFLKRVMDGAVLKQCKVFSGEDIRHLLKIDFPDQHFLLEDVQGVSCDGHIWRHAANRVEDFEFRRSSGFS